MRNRENKNYRFVSFQPEEQKKIPKKFKKFKNTIMASLLAKIGWKRLRMRENKNYPSVPFLPEARQKILKKGKKIKKIKKYHCGFILSQSRLENARKERE